MPPRKKKSTTKSPSKTTVLALFFWCEILGKDEDAAWSDLSFKRQYLRHAKLALKDGADLDTLKLALKELLRDYKLRKIDRIFSIQQALDWRKRGAKGMTYYQWAQAELEKYNTPPPIWDTFARMEWEIRHGGANGKQVHSTSA